MNKLYLKAALAGVSNDPTRAVLNSVLLKQKADELTIVSTNGHELFRSRIEQKPSEAPLAITKDTLIPTEVVKTILKSCTARPANTNVYVGNGSVRVDLATTVDFTPIDAEYPNYEKCIPSHGEGSTFTLDLVVLEDLVEWARAIREASGQKRYQFRLRFFSSAPDKAIYIELPDAEREGHFDAVVMPMRDKERA